MIIHTNAAVDQPIYWEDRDGNRIALDADATYRFAVKKHREDPDAEIILTFETFGSEFVGTGSITVVNGLIDGKVSDYFRLRAAQALVADLAPGTYFADMITTAPTLQNLFDAALVISRGVSPQ
jgi:hypothetical protein